MEYGINAILKLATEIIKENFTDFGPAIKWAVIFFGLSYFWSYHIGPLAWWIVEIWRRGAV